MKIFFLSLNELLFKKYYLFSALITAFLCVLQFLIGNGENDIIASLFPGWTYLLACLVLGGIYNFSLQVYEKKYLSRFALYKVTMLFFLVNICCTDIDLFGSSVLVDALEILSALLIISDRLYYLFLPVIVLISCYIPDALFAVMLFALVTYYCFIKQENISFRPWIILMAYLASILIWFPGFDFCMHDVMSKSSVLLAAMIMYIIIKKRLKRDILGRIFETLIIVDCAFCAVFGNNHVTCFYVLILFSVLIISQEEHDISKSIFPEYIDLERFNRGILYICLILIIFNMIHIYRNVDEFIDIYRLCHYYLNYIDYGFVQRGFMGTIIRMIFGYYIPFEKMEYIVSFLYYSMLLLICLICAMLSRLNKNHLHFYAPCQWLFLLLIIPSLLKYHQDCLDIFIAFIGIISICIVLRNSGSIFWVIPLNIVGVMIHPVHSFIAFPIVFVALCIRTILISEGNYRRNLLLIIATTMAVIGLFFYFSFFSYKLIPVDINSAKKIFELRTGQAVSVSQMCFWRDENLVFRSDQSITVSEHVEFFMSQIGRYQLTKSLSRFLLISPLFICCFYEYRKWALLFENRWKRLICMLLPCVICMVVLPLYIVETDWGRWNLHLVLMIIMGIIIPGLADERFRNYLSEKVSVKQEIIFGGLLVAGSLFSEPFMTSF